MEDKRHLFPKLVHPKKANVGDYVFVFVGPGALGIDILRVQEWYWGGFLRVEGNVGRRPPTCYLPPTEYRKQRYLEASHQR